MDSFCMAYWTVTTPSLDNHVLQPVANETDRKYNSDFLLDYN